MGETAPDTVYVFPTRVGVNRWPRSMLLPTRRFPHARGGEPVSATYERKWNLFSPRAWG